MTPRSARPLATATCPSHSRSPATPPRSRRHPMRSRGTRGVAPRPPRTASACRRWDQVPAGLAFVPSLSKGTTHLQHLLAVESGPIEVPRHESHHRRGHHTHADGHRVLVLLCEGLELPLQGRGRLQVALPVADPGQADETLDPSLTRSPRVDGEEVLQPPTALVQVPPELPEPPHPCGHRRPRSVSPSSWAHPRAARRLARSASSRRSHSPCLAMASSDSACSTRFK